MLRAMVCSWASSLADNSRPVNTTTGTSASAASLRMHSSTSKPDMSGSRRSSTTQSQAPCAQDLQRLPAGAGIHDLDVVMAEQLADAHLLGGVVLDHQQAPAARLREVLDLAQGVGDAFARRRLGDEGERAAREPVLAIFVERDDLHGDMAGERVLLELAEHIPAQHVGQEDVERHCGRLILLGEIERVVAAHGEQHLEALVAGEVEQDARVMRIVLDDEQDGIAGLDFQPVVGNLLDACVPPIPPASATALAATGRGAVAEPTYLIGR